jgi:hypothetical protein
VGWWASGLEKSRGPSNAGGPSAFIGFIPAGNDAVDDLTANVEAAAQLAVEIDRALESRELVDRLLSGSANR